MLASPQVGPVYVDALSKAIEAVEVLMQRYQVRRLSMAVVNKKRLCLWFL